MPVLVVQTDTPLTDVRHSYVVVAEPDGEEVATSLAVVLADGDGHALFRARTTCTAEALAPLVREGVEIALVQLGAAEPRPTAMVAAMRGIGTTLPFVLARREDAASLIRHARLFGDGHPLCEAARLAVGGKPTPEGQDYSRLDGRVPWSSLTDQERLVRVTRRTLDGGVR